MSPGETVIGLLLAGGKSSRMGGGDKCLRLLAGRPIIERIIGRLKPQVSGIVINANGDSSRFAAYGLPVVADRIAGFAGPLAGIHAGLEWIKANRAGASHAVTVASDTPFFPLDLVRRFLKERRQDDLLLVARSDEGVHPVIGLWPITLASAIEDFLKREKRKVGRFAEEEGSIEVYFPKTEIGGVLMDPFFNINEPEELAKAEMLLKEQAR
jgi:molybdopterin-guanine dinucleotide biosynthesis protein A